jgi:hypothetical protein
MIISMMIRFAIFAFRGLVEWSADNIKPILSGPVRRASVL